MDLDELNRLPAAEAERTLRASCASRAWAAAVAARRPFASLDALLEAADEVWGALPDADRREAFAAHPRIGERGGARSEREQARVREGGGAVLAALADANRAYERRFGHVFLICAEGRSAEDVLGALRARMANTPEAELAVAFEEQRRITRLRLRSELGAPAFELAGAEYGKAETHLVHVRRAGDVSHVTDLVVGVTLRGAFEAAYVEGDNAAVLPTDTQKNTVFAFARDGVGEIEEFALRLARHFVEAVAPVREARVEVAEQPWERTGPHAFSRSGTERRRTEATCAADGSARVTSGLDGLSLLRTTGSAFRGFLRDRYTTLPEADDRVLATAVDARWRFGETWPDWGEAHAAARASLIQAFAARPSLALQQTLYDMGGAVLEAVPAIAEVRLSMPNQHHFLVDLSPFGLDNPDRVYHASDRPYGLIAGTVRRRS